MTHDDTPRDLAARLVQALGACDYTALERLLAEDATLRVWGFAGKESHRPRRLALRRLAEEWSQWPDATSELFETIADGDRASVEFRIQATDGGRFVEHNRCAMISVAGGRITFIDLYCAKPMPSVRRRGWIAPKPRDEAELLRVLGGLSYGFDIRERPKTNQTGIARADYTRWGSLDSHPASNNVSHTHILRADADRMIEDVIAWYRERNIGFHWTVGPEDIPRDLSARLLRHGLVYAGDQALMARVGLDAQEIPENPNVVIRRLDADDEAGIEASLQVVATGFQWTPEMIANERANWFREVQDPKERERGSMFLATIDGAPVGQCYVGFQCGLAYLGGAATLPEYRSQKVYSTMLKRRLSVAHEAGYAIAAIHAEPMSRRVVTRYGFKEYGRYEVFGWMPEIDMDVIDTIVQDQ